MMHSSALIDPTAKAAIQERVLTWDINWIPSGASLYPFEPSVLLDIHVTRTSAGPLPRTAGSATRWLPVVSMPALDACWHTKRQL